MSNLVEMIFEMEENNQFDCIVLQKMYEGSNNAPDVYKSLAIIRKIPTASGVQWAVHSLMLRPHRMIISGSGMYGGIEEVVAFTEKWYPSDGKATRWVGMNYIEPTFPPNLIPM